MSSYLLPLFSQNSPQIKTCKYSCMSHINFIMWCHENQKCTVRTALSKFVIWNKLPKWLERNKYHILWWRTFDSVNINGDVEIDVPRLVDQYKITIEASPFKIESTFICLSSKSQNAVKFYHRQLLVCWFCFFTFSCPKSYLKLSFLLSIPVWSLGHGKTLITFSCLFGSFTETSTFLAVQKRIKVQC